MPRLERDAKVVVTLKGLGFAHYYGDKNSATGDWEIMLLQIGGHNATIKINKYLKNSPNGIPLGTLPANISSSFSVTTDNAVQPRAYRYTSDDFLWRQNIDDFFDARWFPNFSEELYKTPVYLKKPQDANLQLNLIKVSDAILYTYQQTDRFQEYPIVKEENGRDTPVRKGVMGQVAGLDIKWKDNASITKITGLTTTPIELKYERDLLLYEIVIDNDCSNCGDSPDFHLYYDQLINERKHTARFRENPPYPPKRYLSSEDNDSPRDCNDPTGDNNKSIMVGKTDCHIGISEDIYVPNDEGGYIENGSLANLF